MAASAAVNIAPPVLPPAPRDELIAAAVRWHNADPESVLFPIVVEFIRDRLEDYRNRARPIGLPVDQAVAAVDRKVLEAIAVQYPWLVEERGKWRGPASLASARVDKPNLSA